MTKVSRRNVLLGAAGISLVGIAGYGAARTFIPWHKATGTIFNVKGVAVRGTDVVSYFTQSKPVAGSDRYKVNWAGVDWHFSSMEHREMFNADPLAYAPQYGGYCAWAVAAKGLLYSVQPENWHIVDGKLYLNFNKQVHDTWKSDIPGFIAEADRRWPELRDQMV